MFNFRLGRKESSELEQREARLSAREDQAAAQERENVRRAAALDAREANLNWAQSFGNGLISFYDGACNYLLGKADKYVDERMKLLAKDDHDGLKSS